MVSVGSSANNINNNNNNMNPVNNNNNNLVPSGGNINNNNNNLNSRVLPPSSNNGNILSNGTSLKLTISNEICEVIKTEIDRISETNFYVSSLLLQLSCMHVCSTLKQKREREVIVRLKI